MTDQEMATALLYAAIDDELVEVGRLAIEDELIAMRDDRISILNRGNGLVIREKDGTLSSIIRIGTPEAIRIALHAMVRAKDK